MRKLATGSNPAIRLYYAATVIFLLLDYLGGINVRVAFLDSWPGWRGAYYVFCFGCLAVIALRPALTSLVATTESLITLSALIISMGVRVMTLPTTLIEQGGSFVTGQEIVNFVIAGFAAWWGWVRGSAALQEELRS